MKTILSSLIALMPLLCSGQDVISLAGQWRFATDPEQTISPTDKLPDTITLPGSMNTNGLGNKLSAGTQWTGSLYDSSFYFNPYMERYRQEGEMKFPFFLTPRTHYTGHAWYQHTVRVPKGWKGRQVQLYLERPHIETEVYVDGKPAGEKQMSLSVPHVWDLTPLLTPGKEHTLSVRIYNGIENVCVGQDSHSVTDQTQGNWNGMAGRIELRCLPKDGVVGTRIYPHMSLEAVEVHAFLSSKRKRTVAMSVLAPDGKVLGTSTLNGVAGDTIQTMIRLNDMTEKMLWDEHHPTMLTLRTEVNGQVHDTPFGMREVGVKGSDILINGKAVYLRGTVENCLFPLTGYPPTDVESWEKVLSQCKAWGINHVRFHSYCPPDAAFTAADRLGIYLQPEGPSWPNHGVKLRRGMSIDEYLLRETQRICDEYGNHPSFVMMAAGNEPAGDWVAWCNDWVKTMKHYDLRRIYAGASVGGGWAWDDGSEFHVKGGARGLNWERKAPQTMDDHSEQLRFPRNYKLTTPNNSPIVAHEQGQWCVFPDFKERALYDSCANRAYNFDIFEDLLQEGGMASQADNFLMASGKLQTLAYKYDIERNLRTPGYTGFQLLGLNDYSGQGTALVGPLNVFWQEKGYVSAREWRQWCSELVPLASMPRFVYSPADTLRVDMQVYNASGRAFEQTRLVYDVIGPDGKTMPIHIGRCNVGIGKNQPLPAIAWPLSDFTKPTKLTLRARVGEAVNQWDFWVYPDEPVAKAGKGVMIADSLDADARRHLQGGGTVLLTAAGRISYGSDVKQNYLPVFWNTSWFKMRPPHTTGASIDTTHPLFAHHFATDNWQNLNWWELVNRAQVINISELPKEYQPPYQPIDTWHVSRKLAMIVEANVMGGKVLLTTFDLKNALDKRPVARTLRKAILNYMASSDFAPTLSLSPEFIDHLYRDQAPAVNMFTNDSPDELKPKIK